MAVPSTLFTSVLSTTLYSYVTKGKLADNIYNGLRTMQVMLDQGGKQYEDGGDTIAAQLEYAQNPTAQWIPAYGSYNTTPADVVTAAQFSWKQLTATVIVTDDEMARNSGKSRITNLVEAKVNNVMKAMRTKLNDALFSDGSDTTLPVGLEAICSTTGTLGGIDRSAQTWWRANVDSTSERLQVSKMITMFNNCTHNLDRPKAIVTTQTLYEYYEALAQSFQEISSNANGDIGFENLRFKGVPLWWDQASTFPSGTMYFLNWDYLKVVTHRDWEFRAIPAVRPANQPLEVHAIAWFGAIVPNNPRMLGKLSNKTN